MINYKEFIDKAREYTQKEGWHYLYGYKGEEINKAQNAEFLTLYPKIWGQSNYQSKSKAWLGQRAVDCSGLVYLALNKEPKAMIGSGQMVSKWPSIKTPKAGAIAWRPGHVAIVSKVEGGQIYIIEAAGIEAGLRERLATAGEFKKYLLCPYVDYTEAGNKYAIGWNRDSKGWWYSPDGATYLKGGAYKCPWSKNPAGNWFYFDNEGYCIITDPNGCMKEPRFGGGE